MGKRQTALLEVYQQDKHHDAFKAMLDDIQLDALSNLSHWSCPGWIQCAGLFVPGHLLAHIAFANLVGLKLLGQHVFQQIQTSLFDSNQKISYEMDSARARTNILHGINKHECKKATRKELLHCKQQFHSDHH